MTHILGEERLQDIGAVRHHFLSVDVDALQNTRGALSERAAIFNFWLDQVAIAGGVPQNVAYSATAWTVDSSNFGNNQAGMPAALNLLALLNREIGWGVDHAYAWGIAAARIYQPHGQPANAISFWQDDGQTPVGALLGLMAEVLPGMAKLDAGKTLLMSDDVHNDFLLSAYGDDDKVVLFVGVGDLDGETLRLNFGLGALGPFTSAQIDMIRTTSGALSGFVTVDSSTASAAGGWLSLTFNRDFQTARVIIEKATPNFSGPDPSGTISGTDGIDSIVGSLGDDVIFGNGGADRINDRGGDNFIYGGAGADVIRGASGDDSIFGGDGDDTIFESLGLNRIYGGAGR